MSIFNFHHKNWDEPEKETAKSTADTSAAEAMPDQPKAPEQTEKHSVKDFQSSLDDHENTEPSETPSEALETDFTSSQEFTQETDQVSFTEDTDPNFDNYNDYHDTINYPSLDKPFVDQYAGAEVDFSAGMDLPKNLSSEESAEEITIKTSEIPASPKEEKEEEEEEENQTSEFDKFDSSTEENNENSKNESENSQSTNTIKTTETTDTITAEEPNSETTIPVSTAQPNSEPENTGAYTMQVLPLSLLRPSKLNEGVSEDEIDSLKESIRNIGLTDNPVVSKKGDHYEILAGHRRYKALTQLVAEGDTRFTEIECKVVNLNAIDLPVSDELKEKYIHATTNTEARKMTTQDQIIFQKALEEVYNAMKEQGVDVGSKREFIAEKSGLSPHTISINNKINAGISSELKQYFTENGEPSKNQLIKIVKYSKKRQKKLLAYLQEKHALGTDITESFMHEFEHPKKPPKPASAETEKNSSETAQTLADEPTIESTDADTETESNSKPVAEDSSDSSPTEVPSKETPKNEETVDTNKSEDTVESSVSSSDEVSGLPVNDKPNPKKSDTQPQSKQDAPETPDTPNEPDSKDKVQTLIQSFQSFIHEYKTLEQEDKILIDTDDSDYLKQKIQEIESEIQKLKN